MDTFIEKRYEGRSSTEIAIASFAIGTVIFVMHLLAPKEIVIFICGFIYVMLAALLNTVVFLNLLYHFIVLPGQREYLAIKMLIVLANIPIALFYMALIFNVL